MKLYCDTIKEKRLEFPEIIIACHPRIVLQANNEAAHFVIVEYVHCVEQKQTFVIIQQLQCSGSHVLFFAAFYSTTFSNKSIHF